MFVGTTKSTLSMSFASLHSIIASLVLVTKISALEGPNAIKSKLICNRQYLIHENHESYSEK